MATQEDRTGSECTGNSGETNRVLTLNNTELTESENFEVYVSGLLVSTSDYNVTHNDSSSTITFTRKIYDDMNISIIYTTTAESVSVTIVDRQIDRYGEDVILITASETTYSAWGDMSQTTSSSTITVVHNDINGDEEFNREGRYSPGDKTFFAKSTVTGLSVANKIKFDENNYEIKDVITHRLQGATQCHEVRCNKV